MIDSFSEEGPFGVLFLGGFSVLSYCRIVIFFFQFSLPGLWEYTYHYKILQYDRPNLCLRRAGVGIFVLASISHHIHHYDPVRSNPRFQELLRKMNLPVDEKE
jgi:hypothetical protein